MILLCCLVLMFGYAISQGPQEDQCALNFDSPVYVCPDELSQELLDTSEIEVIRYNETISYMTGKFKLLKTFDKCTVVELIVEKTTGSRTEVIVTHDICDLCEEINEDSSYRKYLKYFKFPASCPLEQREYEICDFVTDSDDMPLTKANEARYQATLNFYANPQCDCKEKDPLGCVKIDFVIESV